MKNCVNARFDALKAVAPRHTYDLGFRDVCRGVALDVRNGRLFEKTQRKIIFLKSEISSRPDYFEVLS